MENSEYWKNEAPVTAETPHYILRFYRKARRFQFCLKPYKTLSGSVKPGKNFGLAIDDFDGAESALKLIKEAFKYT